MCALMCLSCACRVSLFYSFRRYHCFTFIIATVFSQHLITSTRGLQRPTCRASPSDSRPRRPRSARACRGSRMPLPPRGLAQAMSLFRELRIPSFRGSGFKSSQIPLKRFPRTSFVDATDTHRVARPRVTLPTTGRTRSECKPISCAGRHVRPIPAPFLLPESRLFPSR